jgi:uncharacterized protein
MKSLKEIKSVLASNKSRLHDQFGVCELGVFGSYARNDQSDDSDLDILVDFDAPVGLEFVDLATELEKILGVRIDLVSKNGIKPRYFESIEEDLIYV